MKVTGSGSVCREKLAAYAHNAWSGWIKYMFDKCERMPDGALVIPKWAVDRWSYQAHTDYQYLPENMKKSDREEADRMLAITWAHTGRSYRQWT